jgi:single-strand DNA-binding protein
MQSTPSTNVAVYKNEVHISGELAKDPVTRYTATGKTVANLTVLTKYQEKSEYHRVTAWEKLAEKVAALHKGEFVKVVGRLQTRNWEDADQVKHYATEIVAFQLVPTCAQEPAETNIHGVEVTDDDIPF